MKKLFTSIALSLALCSTIGAQTKVTYRTNALIPGDERTLTKFEYTDNSQSGPAQVWDFSKAQTSESMVISQGVNTGVEVGNLNLGSSNNLLECNEGDEKNTYFEISKNQKMYWGLKGKGGAFIQFNEPIVDLPFPFAYGDIVSGPMDGSYTDNDGKVYSIEGQYFTTADAWGTLILPDGSKYDNVLRVKVEKFYKQPLGSLNFDIHTVRYQYFAPGVRYPVMIALVDDTKSDCNCACGQSHNEYAYYQSESSVIALRSTEEVSNEQAEEANFELSAYPNPFKSVLVASYTSNKAGDVTLDILDANGKLVKSFGKFNVEEGTNTVTLETSDLGLGYYVLRATFDGGTYAQNVVKK